VYALTSRLWLHGDALYRGVVLAQPPGVVAFGAGALAIHDGLQWLRIVVGVWEAAGALALAGVVWTGTGGHRAATIATAALALVAPWTVHELGQLTPETIAAPLLAIGWLLALRGHSAWVGVVAGVLVMVKVPMAAPAVALIFVAPDRWRAGLVGAAVVGLLAGIVYAAGGSAVWTNVFVAQSQTGTRTLHALGGYGAQALWNLLPLLVVGAFAWRQWRLSVVAAATLLTLATTVKVGTALNVIVVVEAGLVPVAVVGALELWRRRDALRWLPVAAAALLAVQTVSLVAAPEHPTLFLRPGSANAWARVPARTVRVLERPYSDCNPVLGPPLLAFLRHRAIAGNQPDGFLISHSATLRRRYSATLVARCHG
jgi:hypothetical protein